MHAEDACEDEEAGPIGLACGAYGTEEAEEQEWVGPPHRARGTACSRPDQ